MCCLFIVSDCPFVCDFLRQTDQGPPNTAVGAENRAIIATTAYTPCSDTGDVLAVHRTR
jgi:hypothetical protein